ncbi:MAG: trimethylamine methyltransferase family protein [Anaerolineales bacterium]|nr:trimethylamine methyltransferase family protein [Anaerolineales bacterium]
MIMRLNLFSEEERQRIHGRILDVLQDVGVKFGSIQALEILGDAGCEVDKEELSAKIPPRLVEKALETVPRSFRLAARDPEKDVIYGEGGPYFLSAAQSVFYRDLETRERRVATLEDLTHVTILCDALDEIDLFCPMIAPNDVHPYMRGLRAGQVAFHNTDKHIVGGVGALETLPYHLEIWDAILGDRARLKERPMMTHIINDVSPLQKDGNLVDVTLALSDYQFPILLYYMPMAGSTAPVTLAGTLIEMTANMLASVVLYQLIQPGWPIIWGAGPGTLDMKSGRFAGGAEAALISIGQVELAQFYGLPSMSGWIGSYESKEVDFQSGMDATLGVVPVILAGADGIWGPGDLDGSNLVDLPYVLVGTELVQQLKRLKRGIAFDDEHFLFDVIAKMRFQGDYLADPSTKKYFRQEHLLPNLFPRESYESWEARGQTEEEMALARVQQILKTHQPTPLPDEVGKEIDRIINAAEEALTN